MQKISLKTYENLLNDYFDAYGVYNWKIQSVFSDIDFGGRIYFATCTINPYSVDKDSLQFFWFENGRLYTQDPYKGAIDLLLHMRDANYFNGELATASYELEEKFKEVFGK